MAQTGSSSSLDLDWTEAAVGWAAAAVGSGLLRRGGRVGRGVSVTCGQDLSVNSGQDGSGDEDEAQVERVRGACWSAVAVQCSQRPKQARSWTSKISQQQHRKQKVS